MWNFKYCKSDIGQQGYRPKTDLGSSCLFCVYSIPESRPAGRDFESQLLTGLKNDLAFWAISLVFLGRFAKFKVPHVAEDVDYVL